jgi:hypothetical protein
MILVTNEQKYADTISDQTKKKEFQDNVGRLRELGIPRDLHGTEAIQKSIQSDPALPRAVSERHSETVKVALAGATEVNARRHSDGTYVIDYKGRTGKDERLTLDGVGNVTHARRGLELTTNTLRHPLDTTENEKINADNQKLNTTKNGLIVDGYRSLSNLEQANQRVNPDSMTIEPIVR